MVRRAFVFKVSDNNGLILLEQKNDRKLEDDDSYEME